MLRSVSNQITGEAAVQRNKMAEEFKRQGYRADVAYDMANFQIIGSSRKSVERGLDF